VALAVAAFFVLGSKPKPAAAPADASTASQPASPQVAGAQEPPAITNWRDVTGDLREKARSKPGLLVEPDAIRLEPGNEQPLNVAITDVPARSLTVRVAYTGQAQISLWFKESVGSVFVLARQKETIFNRVDEVKTTVSLRPPVPNPADFDNTAPHELLLAVQDSVLRAWIDGRFIGEVQNDLFKEVGMALAITKLSAVRKVAIAELKNTVSEAKTGAKLDEDFIRAAAAAPADK